MCVAAFRRPTVHGHGRLAEYAQSPHASPNNTYGRGLRPSGGRVQGHEARVAGLPAGDGEDPVLKVDLVPAQPEGSPSLRPVAAISPNNTG